MPLRFEPMYVFISAFSLASLGGVAAAIRSKQKLTARYMFGSFFYSGLVGLLVALAWYEYYDGKDNIAFLLAISGLAGIGGATALDLIRLFFAGKLHITLNAQSEEDDTLPIKPEIDDNTSEPDGVVLPKRRQRKPKEQ